MEKYSLNTSQSELNASDRERIFEATGIDFGNPISRLDSNNRERKTPKRQSTHKHKNRKAQSASAEISDEEEIGVLVSDIQRENIEWLWKDRLALGKLTILDGDPGLGKSTLYCDIAARITTGMPWPDAILDSNTIKRQPRGVVIVTCEDGIGDTIRPRLEEAGADLDKCRVIQTVRFNKRQRRFTRAYTGSA